MGGDEDMSFAWCPRGLFFLFFGLCLLAHSFSREKREMMRRVASKVRDRDTWRQIHMDEQRERERHWGERERKVKGQCQTESDSSQRHRETLGVEREKGKGSVPNGE